MKSMNKKLIVAGIGMMLLLAGTAFATSYFTQAAQPMVKSNIPSKYQAKTHNQGNPQVVAAAAPVEPRCDDSNVLGYVAGGAVGGIAGNQIGKGSGNTAATIAGTLGGAYLGGQYIPLRNVTCR